MVVDEGDAGQLGGLLQRDAGDLDANKGAEQQRQRRPQGPVLGLRVHGGGALHPQGVLDHDEHPGHATAGVDLTEQALDPPTALDDHAAARVEQDPRHRAPRVDRDVDPGDLEVDQL